MNKLVYLVLILLFSCSSIEEQIVGTWIIDRVIHHENRIEIENLDQLKLNLTGENVSEYILINEDGTCTLPGIKSNSIRCKWKAADNMISFFPDSAFYDRMSKLNLKDSVLQYELSFEASLEERLNEFESTVIQRNSLLNGELSFASPIYFETFEIRFIGDQDLMLVNKNTRITAHKWVYHFPF